MSFSSIAVCASVSLCVVRSGMAQKPGFPSSQAPGCQEEQIHSDEWLRNKMLGNFRMLSKQVP